MYAEYRICNLMFILALISAMKTYCKKNNSHCIPKAPKRLTHFISLPLLYISDQDKRLVPICVYRMGRRPTVSALILTHSRLLCLLVFSFQCLRNFFIPLEFSYSFHHTSRIQFAFMASIRYFRISAFSSLHRSGSLPYDRPFQRTEGALTGDHFHP